MNIIDVIARLFYAARPTASARLSWVVSGLANRLFAEHFLRTRTIEVNGPT